MKKTKTKRIIAIVMAVIISLSTIVSVGVVVFGAATGENTKIYLVYYPRSSDSNASGNWGHGKLNFHGGWTKASATYLDIKIAGSYYGNVAYCIEPGVDLEHGVSGESMAERDKNYLNNISNGVIETEDLQSFIGRIMYYGYQGGVSADWRSQNTSDANNIANAVATQLLIWETVVGERDEDFNHISYSEYDDVLDIISSNHPLRSRIMSYYNSIVSNVQSHTKIPSFCSKTSGKAKVNEMTWKGEKYVAVFTDTNNVLEDYDFSANVSGVSFEKSGNQLTVSMSKAPTDVVVITATKNNAKSRSIVVWSSDNSFDKSSKVQDVVTYGQTVSDTVTSFAKLKVSYGSLKIFKTSEDSEVSGIDFTVTGDNFEQTVTTDDNGTVEVANLIPDDYIVAELTDEKYAAQDSQKITVTAGQTTTVSFSNKLKKFSATVTKSDKETVTAQGDASLAGAKYGIYNGETLVDEYYTDENGQFTTKEYVCGDSWYLKELSPSEGYLIDDTVYSVGAEPKNYTVEHNLTAVDVTEQVINGNVAIIKHTDNGNTQIETPEEGAIFELYLKSAGSYDNANENERDTLICDENGFAQSKNLPYGTYTVHQTSGWDGREFMSDFDVFISENEHTYRYLINNANFESYIKIVKKDAETGNVIPYAGAGFQIYNAQGELVTMRFTYPSITETDIFYTDSDGSLITPEKLEYGEGYSIVEVQGPYGYVIDDSPVYFDITESNSTQEGGVTMIEVEKYNVAQKGVITVEKSGEFFSGVAVLGDENEIIYQPLYEMQSLSGAVYEVRAAEDIYTPDGTLRAYENELVDTVTTDESGFATSKELYLGKYRVEEVTAPFGMVLSEESHTVELVYAGQNASVTETATSFINERQKVEISLMKSVETDDIFGIGNNGEVKNVRFGVFAAEELVSMSGTSIPADGLIEVISPDENGTATFKTDLPFGNYYVIELSTDEHYLIDDTKYPVVFDYAGQDIVKVTLSVNNGQPIENKLIYGSVTGKKTDTVGNGIGGAVIGLFSADITDFITENALMTTVSSDDGSFSFKNIPFGSWVVKELDAPNGYVLSEKIFDVDISDDGQVIELTIENSEIPATPDEATKDEAKNSTSPKTGDSTNIAVWLILLGVSFAGITVCSIIAHRRKKKEAKDI